MKQIRGRPMAGRTVLITGGTAGIGKATKPPTPFQAASPQSDVVDTLARHEIPDYVRCTGPQPEEEQVVTVTHVRKAEIVAILRSRGKFERADWFQRALPDIIDVGKNSSLLANLEIDADALKSTDRIPGAALV
jgi:hypothetical protein